MSPHDLIDIQSCISIALSLPRQFLQDTLDTLFGILDESSQRYGLKVFDCLVSGYCFCGLPFPSILFSPSLTAKSLVDSTRCYLNAGWSQDWDVMTAELIVCVRVHELGSRPSLIREEGLCPIVAYCGQREKVQ